MRRWKPLASVLIIATILGGGMFFWFTHGHTPTTDLQLSDGETVAVTPTDEMRVRSALGQPDIDLAEYRLTVEGFVQNELSLTFDDLQAMDSQERLVNLHCVEGWTETGVWKGPRLADVLDRAGVLQGANNVVLSGADGYTTSLTLDDVSEAVPLLAYRVNGDMLPADQGFPLRLVVPGKLGYKWIKWVTDINVLSGQYKGYWESRGYSNQADIPAQ